MSGQARVPAQVLPVLAGELRKMPAFVRRDFLTAWSYRLPFFTDLFSLMGQIVVFYFVGRLVESDKLPRYGGAATTYLEFVVIGITMGAFVQLALARVAIAIRNEQLMGTLECLLATPTGIATIQLGSAVYDLLYVPLRTALFLLIIAVGFDLDFRLDGIGPAAVTLLVFIPFVWGLGIAAAAATLTFRVGGTLIGFGLAGLTLVSGAYFPLDLLPEWATTVAEYNPMALAIEGMREALLGGAGWSGVSREVLLLMPAAALSLMAGMTAFVLALRRERRRGTLSLY